MRKLVLPLTLVLALAAAPQALAAAPALVSATSVNGHAVVTWTMPADVEPLQVEISTSPDTNLDGSFVTVESASYLFSTQTTWTDSNFLDAGLTYYVHVGGTDMSCPTCPLTEYSNVLTFVGSEATGPDAPITARLTIRSDGSGGGTVTSNPSGLDCGVTCVRTYLRNIHITLTPTPAPGSVFTGWSGGGCSGWAPTCEVVLNVSQTVVATFDRVAPPSLPDLLATRNSTTATATFTVCDDSPGLLSIALIQVWQERGQWKSTTSTTTQDQATRCASHTISAPLGVRSAPRLWLAVQVTDVDGRQSSLRTAAAP